MTKPSARLRRGAAAVLAALLCGCARDTVYNPSHFHIHGPIAPPDVVVSANARAGETIDGLTLIGGDSGLCCAIASHARLSVRKRAFANWLRVGFYIPDAGAVGSGSDALRITFADGSKRSIAFRAPGQHLERVLVPLALRAARGPQRMIVDRSAKAPYVLISAYFE